MNRDTKRRTKEMIYPFPSVDMIVNWIIALFILFQRIFIAFKFNLVEKINYLSDSWFFDDSRCVSNGESKY